MPRDLRQYSVPAPKSPRGFSFERRLAEEAIKQRHLFERARAFMPLSVGQSIPFEFVQRSLQNAGKVNVSSSGHWCVRRCQELAAKALLSICFDQFYGAVSGNVPLVCPYQVLRRLPASDTGSPLFRRFCLLERCSRYSEGRLPVLVCTKVTTSTEAYHPGSRPWRASERRYKLR